MKIKSKVFYRLLILFLAMTMVLTACSSSGTNDQAGESEDGTSESTDTTKDSIDEEITTDIVVVGGGASGTSAALAAAEKGAEVVIIEKTSTTGGAGRYLAVGLLAFESAQQKEAGYTETAEDGFQYLVDYAHYMNNGNLVREVLKQSSSTIDWLANYGAETKLIKNTQKLHDEGYPHTYHQYVDREQAYVNMYEHLDDMGVTLYTKTVGKELIQDSDGRVTGIIAEKEDGSKLQINAQKVILATGGYAGSPDMLKEYINFTNYTTMAYPNNTGDGINMALDAGADEFYLNSIAVHAATVPSSEMVSAGQLLNLPLMWVNREGKRFVDEGIVYDFALWGNAALSQGGEYFVVFDETTMKEFVENGSDLTNSFEKTYMVSAGADPAGATGKVAPMPDLYEAMDTLINDGAAFKGETIEELAEAMDVNAEHLKDATESYSQAVIDGKDPRFLKDPEYLKYSVENGPFYALKAAVLVENTVSGVRVNESLQVLREDFKPIEGLYAVGCDAGGMYGDSYPDLEGLNLCFAFNSGRLAGYAAAESLD